MFPNVSKEASYVEMKINVTSHFSVRVSAFGCRLLEFLSCIIFGFGLNLNERTSVRASLKVDTRRLELNLVYLQGRFFTADPFAL